MTAGHNGRDKSQLRIPNPPNKPSLGTDSAMQHFMIEAVSWDKSEGEIGRRPLFQGHCIWAIRTFSWFLDFWRAIYIPQDLGDKDQAGDQFQCCRSGLDFPINQLLYSFRLSYPRLIQSFTLHMFISFPGQMKIEDSCLTCDKISNALFCIYSLHSIQVICQASFITTDLLNTIQ